MIYCILVFFNLFRVYKFDINKLTNDEISNCSCELVKENTNRLTIASQDQVFTILCVWGRKVVLSCYRNKNVDGVKLIYMKKSFKLKDNMIDWKKFDTFVYKVVDKFMTAEENEEDLIDLKTDLRLRF
mgnify:CR=1 FL=1